MTATEPTLDEVAAEFPGWECWRGIAGLLYARKMLSSPPVVIRAEDPRTSGTRSGAGWEDSHERDRQSSVATPSGP